MIPKSFVPEEPIQDLRELTRLRKMWIESRNREKNRAHKVLQTAGIKLISYMTDIFGLSGRNLLHLLINEEEITAEKVEKAVYSSLKFKVSELIEGLTGFFRSHHRFLLAQVLDVIDMYTSKISELEIKITDYLLPYQQYVDRLVTIPGISIDSAAEYGIENVPLVLCFLPLSAKKCTSKCDAVTTSNKTSDNNDHKVN